MIGGEVFFQLWIWLSSGLFTNLGHTFRNRNTDLFFGKHTKFRWLAALPDGPAAEHNAKPRICTCCQSEPIGLTLC